MFLDSSLWHNYASHLSLHSLIVFNYLCVLSDLNLVHRRVLIQSIDLNYLNATNFGLRLNFTVSAWRVRSWAMNSKRQGVLGATKAFVFVSETCTTLRCRKRQALHKLKFFLFSLFLLVFRWGVSRALFMRTDILNRFLIIQTQSR